jgi:hypothetical protein
MNLFMGDFCMSIECSLLTKAVICRSRWTGWLSAQGVGGLTIPWVVTVLAASALWLCTATAHAEGAATGGKPLNVALLDFKTNNLTDNQKIEVVERLRVLVETHAGCAVVSRVQMLKVLGVKSYSTLFACKDLGCAASEAPRLNADLLITGDVGMTGTSNWNVDLVGLFIRENRVIKAEVKSALPYSSLLETGLRDAFGKLIAQTEKDKEPQPPTLSPEPKTPSQEVRTPPQPARPADLYVTSAPNEGATIVINGDTLAQKTPATIRGLQPGRYRISVLDKGLIGTDSIELKEDDLARLNIKMRHGFGSVKFFSEPAGAMVWIDGKPIGATPVKNDSVLSGKRTVRLKMTDFFVVDTSLDVPVSGLGELSVQLRACAWIEVTPQPKKAQIFINGKQGESDPATDIVRVDVDTGTVVLEALAERYQTWNCTLQVTQGDLKKLYPKLNYLYGKLRVKTEPKYAQVYINGKKVEYDSTAGTARMIVDAGTAIVEIRADSFQTEICTLMVKGGELQDLSTKLKSNYGCVQVTPTPAKAQVRINGIQAESDPQTGIVRMKVKPGRVIVEAEADSFKTWLCSLQVAQGETKELSAILHSNYGSIHVLTIPKAAKVFLNDSLKGVTPLIVNGLAWNQYRLRLQKEMYITVDGVVSVFPDSMSTVSYKLLATPEFIDSLNRIKSQHQARRKMVVRVATGTAFVLFSASSVYSHMTGKKALLEKDNIQNEYNNSTGNFNDYQRRYDEVKKTADQYLFLRYLFGGAAALSAVGLGVTFLF